MRLSAAFACAIAMSTAVFAQTVFGRAGWDAIREGRHEEAAAVFADAIRTEPRDATLYPGDLISTGTPPGVGMGVKPAPVYLRSGDRLRLGVQGLGEQQQLVRAWDRKLFDAA